MASLAARPNPGWRDLAATLARPRDAHRALTHLDRFLSQALQLACVAGGRLAPAAAEVEGLKAADLAVAGRELQRWGLAFLDDEGALNVPAEVASMVWNPGGLGTSAAHLLVNLTVEELRSIAMRLGHDGRALPKRKGELVDAARAGLGDREAIRAVLSTAPPAARADLDALRRAGGSSRGVRLGGRWRPPYSSWAMSWDPRGAEDGVGWLVEHGIALPEDEPRSTVAVPAEVERALRGRVFAAWDVSGPALEPARLHEERHPIELITAMDTLLEAWRHAPPSALKEGGAPRREIKRAAGMFGGSEDAAEELVALGFAAGLLREREVVPEKRNRSYRHPRVLQSRRAVIDVTADADRWLRLSEAERWLELALAWLASWDAIGRGRSDRAHEARTRMLFQLLGELEAGHGATVATIGAALSWRHPALFPEAQAAAAFAVSVGQALFSLGAGSAPPVIGMNTAGRIAFVSDAAVDVSALKRAFPLPVDRCVVTADHRVVVPGPPTGELGRILARIAEIASVHPARVYRLTEASLGRAFDSGLAAGEILEMLRDHVSSEIPQNVVALVEDVARRHGRVRVGQAGIYILADDPAQMEVVARNRTIGGNGFRRISPTVAVIDGRDRREVMTALRRAGLMPVLERGSEPAVPAVQPAAPVGAFAAERRAPPPAEPAALDHAAAAALAAALRSAAGPREAIAPAPARSEAVRFTLAEAARRRRPVEIGYQVASGAPAILVVGPLWVGARQMQAQDETSVLRVFDLGRVLWAETVSGDPRPGAEAGHLLELAMLERDDADAGGEIDDVLGDGGGSSRLTFPGR